MRKRVLVVSSEFPPGPGGIGNHAYCLSKGLWHNEHDVHVISIFRERNEDLLFDRRLPFPVKRIGSGQPFRKAKLIIRTIKDLSRDGELVVFASGLAMLVVCGLYSLFSRGRAAKYILIAHGVDISPTSLPYRILVLIGVKGFHKVVPVSSYTAEKIKGISKRKIRVINNGFGPEKFSTVAISKSVLKCGRPSLLTIGSLTYRKGQINVIKALPALLKVYPEIHYHMIGLDYEKPELLKLSRRLGVNDHITFHGPLDDTMLEAQARSSDIFVMLSNHSPSGDFEGFGIAVVEANYLGLPAIGSINSGLRDAIKSGYSGLLIEPNSPQQLVEAVATILRNYDQFSMQAKDHSTEFFWSKRIDQYIDLIAGIDF